jgi:hypothetical protein
MSSTYLKLKLTDQLLCGAPKKPPCQTIWLAFVRARSVTHVHMSSRHMKTSLGHSSLGFQVCPVLPSMCLEFPCTVLVPVLVYSFYVPPSDPLSNSPPTLFWYPPISSPSGFYDSPSDPHLVPTHLLLLRHLSLGLYISRIFPLLDDVLFGHSVEFRRCSFQRHADDSHLLRWMCDRDSPP